MTLMETVAYTLHWRERRDEAAKQILEIMKQHEEEGKHQIRRKETMDQVYDALYELGLDRKFSRRDVRLAVNKLHCEFHVKVLHRDRTQEVHVLTLLHT